MKKFFLLSAMACAAMAVSAQTESAFIDAEAVGIGSDAKAVAAGTVLASSSSVTMKAAYDCDYKTVAMNGEADAYKTIVIDGVEYANLATGVQGQTNPTNTKKATTQQPKDYAIFQFDVTADGMLYVFSKLSANKQYYVFEGAYTEETPSASVAYTIVGGDQLAGDKVYNVAMPADKDGYADYSGYKAAETIGAPFLCDLMGIREGETVGTTTFEDAQKATVLGVAAFPVYKEAGTYYFMAVGSKVTCDGFVFVPGADKIAAVEIKGGDASAIASVNAAAANAQIFNMLGQKVGANAKGLLIIDGKKVIRK